MVLKALNLSNLTHVEAGQLVKTTLKDLQTNGISTKTDVHVNNYVNQLIAKTVIYDKGLLQIVKNEETEKLAELDRSRDLDIAIFRRQFKVFSLSKKSIERAAYKSMAILWANYKNIENLNYEAESNTIDNLVQDLESANFAPHVATLKLGEYLANIKTSNTLFKDSFSKRNSDVASKEVFNMKLIRKDMITNYKNFSLYVVSLAKVEVLPAVYYTNILKSINTSRKYYADMLARRHGGDHPSPPNAQ
jgi:hypothetical protein